MTPEEREPEGSTRTGTPVGGRGLIERIAGASAERCSSALGLLLIAVWAGFAPRRASHRKADQAGEGAEPTGAPVWEPLAAAWQDPALTLSRDSFGRS